MKGLRKLLLPFSLIYGLIIFVRNKLYDLNILKQTSFDIPIISIGNLTVGGTGKTPHTEYLIRLLKDRISLAVLSRGYGRKSGGYKLAELSSSSTEIGDEPRQYKTKFPDIIVAVCEKRVNGIQKLIAEKEFTGTILLDDAFQHRAVKPQLSILLIDYKDLFRKQLLLPTGNLREFSSGAKRADLIVITKTPKIFVPMERRRAQSKYHLLPHQKLFFSYITYGDPIPVWENEHLPVSMDHYFEKDFHFLAVSGIGDPQTFLDHLKERSRNVSDLTFPDHYHFKRKDIAAIQDAFHTIKEKNKIILTTEKDAMRMGGVEFNSLKTLPVFYLPIRIKFHKNEDVQFDEFVLKTCLSARP